jgi:hypothetical protein
MIMKCYRRNFVVFFVIFIGVFWVIYRSIGSDFKGLRRFVISVKAAAVIATAVLGMPSSAYAKENDPSFGVHGFAPPVSRPVPSKYGLFGSRTRDELKLLEKSEEIILISSKKDDN